MPENAMAARLNKPKESGPRVLTVVHLITGLSGGGAERMLARIATYAYGPDAPRQIVISLMDEGIYGLAFRSAGIELHCLNMRNGLSFFPALLRLAAILRSLKPSVLMTWLYHADLVGTLAAVIAGMSMRRVIWNVRCADMNLTHYAFTTRMATALLARLSRFPASVAVNSKAGQRAHTKMGYRPKKWIYLPNGFDLDVWRPDEGDREAVRSELKLADDILTVAMIARVDPQKDHGTFLAAARQLVLRHHNLQFVLIGKGTEALELPELAAGRIIALGERHDVHRLLRGLDIVVLSSMTEGFPNVIGEAMASALPCIVTDVGESAELVAETGIVTPAKDPDALAEAIANMASESFSVRESRGAQARERIQANFSIDRIANLYRVTWLSIAESAVRLQLPEQ
ncbi:MAG: glycosyltransferase [Lysobacterales bacterium]|nr:MAG: glycosyltransferase [Xanthomonadales bacterium]